MVLERESPVSTLEFPPGSAEDKAWQKFGGPILERPLVWHTTTSNDFSEIIENTKQILNKGLLSGIKLGKNNLQDVYLELGRHRERFVPTARAIPAFANLEALIRHNLSGLLPYLPVSNIVEMQDAVLTDLGDSKAYAASFIVDMVTPGMEHKPQEGIATVPDKILADSIWGVVFLHSSEQPLDPLEFDVSVKEVRQMRANARREITRRFKNLPKILEDLYPLFAIDPDQKGQRLSDEVLSDPQGFLMSTIDEWFSLLKESSNPHEALVKFREKRARSEEASITQSILETVQHHLITGIFFHTFIGVLQKKERMGIKVKIPGTPSERFDEFFEMMKQVEHPVPIYGADGALLWPVEMSYEEVRDYFLQKQGYRLP